METDLTYKNKEGISLQQVVDTLSEPLTKKDLIAKLNAKKSIDTLIKKLIEANLIEKETSGRSVLFKLVQDNPLEKIEQDHTISKLVKVDEEKHFHANSDEVDEEALEAVKRAIEDKSGKEVTAILHPRNENKKKEKKKEVTEIYDEVVLEENPYRFVLNFFNSTLNGEKATNYFRRRDNYVVKSIYNKFKTLCDKIEDYNVEQQNLPFYRVIAASKVDKAIKIYHIDMNRMIRGAHKIFALTDTDIKLIFGLEGEKNDHQK